MGNLIDKKQLAEILKVSVKTIDNWVKKGVGPKPVRLGRLIRFKMNEVQEYVMNLKSEEKI